MPPPIIETLDWVQDSTPLPRLAHHNFPVELGALIHLYELPLVVVDMCLAEIDLKSETI